LVKSNIWFLHIEKGLSPNFSLKESIKKTIVTTGLICTFCKASGVLKMNSVMEIICSSSTCSTCEVHTKDPLKPTSHSWNFEWLNVSCPNKKLTKWAISTNILRRQKIRFSIPGYSCSLPRWWIQEIKRMYISCFSHTWFIYNLNTTFIRCRYTCAMVHIHMYSILKYHPVIQSSLCFPLYPLPLCDKLPPLLTWKSLFWWSWCESPSTLVTGWWFTAHPLLPILPLPSQRSPQFMLHVFQRRHHNISYTVWYNSHSCFIILIIYSLTETLRALWLV
jgi:hypothetical protein